MNILGSVLALCLFAFICFEIVGFIKDCVNRKKLKQSFDKSNKKEDNE